MRVLVAGGTGFIGSHLCRALADEGHEVTALSRSPGETPAGVAAATGDVTDYGSVKPVVDGVDAVVNLVALSPLFEPDGGNRCTTEFIAREPGTSSERRRPAASTGSSS